MNKMVEQVKTKSEPCVRFRGFTDEWEERKLEDVVISIQTGTNLLGAESNHGIPLIKMGNIQRGFFSFKKVEFLKDNEEVEERNMANFGDFLFNTRNTLELVGKGATWFGKDNKFAFNSNIARVTFEGINTIFFNYLYNTPQMIKQVQARAVGTTSVAAVYPKDLNSIKFWVPSESEQQKIGELFQTLDKAIDLSNTQVESLKQQKKALLQRLFPQKGETEPNVRLRGFTDEWVEVKLGDVLEKNTTKNKDERITNIESVSNKHGFISQSEQFENHRVASANLSNYYVVQPGMFAYNPSRINVGSIGYKDAFGDISVVSPLYEVFSTKERLDDSFFWYWFSTDVFERERINRTEGSVRDTLNYTAFSGIRTLFPSLEEQQAIGELFQTLDEQIRLAEDKVSQYKELKQALLQRLFV